MESTQKKRVAMCKKGGLFMRLDYGRFITDEEFDKSIKEWAEKINIPVEHIVTFTLGDEDETKEGNAYFCPRCGAYYEYGFEPDTRLYYRRKNPGEDPQPAGYFKTLTIDCTNCNESFNISTEKFDEEAEALTKAFVESQKEGGIKQ